jgi:hypothetical protein
MPYLPPPRIGSVLSRHQPDIVCVIGRAIDDSFRHAVVTNGGKPDEVRMFSAFFFRGLPQLERDLHNILKDENITATVCGIFCHQTPRVKYTGGGVAGDCELSDLTLISAYGGRLANGGIGNAFMTQAKQDRADIQKQSTQRGLYEKGLRFEYVGKKAYGSDERLLPRKDAPALWYWNFDATKSQRHSYYWRGRTSAIHPLHFDTPAEVEVSFEQNVFDMLVGASGRGFKVPVPTDNTWDAIIFDLLRVTCRKAVGQKNVYASAANKLRGSAALDVVSKLVGRDCFAIKNSFAKVFSGWHDEELRELGHTIERSENRYDDADLEREADALDGSGSDNPPTLRNTFDDHPNAEGGSFVLLDFRDNEAPAESRASSTGRLRRLFTFDD